MLSRVVLVALIAVLFLITICYSYVIERNVRDYGAKGDGKTDDTDPIIRALTEERGTDPKAKYPDAIYDSSTHRPAYVYFPAGTYLINQSLPVVYYTQMVGDPDDLPVIKIVSSDPKTDIQVLDSVGRWYPGHSQDNFYKQIRNFIIDMTKCAKCTGVRWQVAQATSITNVYFKSGIGSENQGMFMGDGSGGFLSDLVFEGGKFGMWVGNQQFTSRNITIRDTSVAGIYLNWDWVWTFQGLSISNSPIGIDVNGVPAWKPQGAGSLVVMDSHFNNCTVGIRSHFDRKSPMNTVVLDNISFNPPGAIVKNGDIVELKGGKIKSWVQGRIWNSGKGTFDTIDLSDIKPARSKLLAPSGDEFFQKPRPNYPASSLINVVKDLGFKNDSDITQQLNDALQKYADKKVLFFPSGIYLLSDTVYVPPGSRMVGQVWSVLMATGDKFMDPSKPRAMLQVGKRGEKGQAHLIDFMFSTQGPRPGAKLIEWNMANPDGQPGACGIWDTHFRIGGADGTMINPSNCPSGDGSGAPTKVCSGAWGMMHLTDTGNCYMENIWGWTADHDIDHMSQLNVYNARGFLCESQGPVWMYGTAMEHNYLYQYNFVNASNILMAVIQTETPYYQPSTKTPFETTDSRDPVYCTDDPLCRMSYALHIKDSDNIHIFGTGLYSFFNTWRQDCQYAWPAPKCQYELVKMDNSKQIFTHALNTYGSIYMLTKQEEYSKAEHQANTFCSTVSVDMNNF